MFFTPLSYVAVYRVRDETVEIWRISLSRKG
jgi:hypothetical protein